MAVHTFSGREDRVHKLKRSALLAPQGTLTSYHPSHPIDNLITFDKSRLKQITRGNVQTMALKAFFALNLKFPPKVILVQQQYFL